MPRPAGPTKANSLLSRLAFFASKRRLGKVAIPLRLHALSSPLLWGYGQMELAQQKADKVPLDLKKLTSARAATLIGCPF